MTFELPETFWTKTRAEDCGYKSPCLTWTAYKLPNGYGRVGYQGKVHYAHRLAYEAKIGPLPPGPAGPGRLVVDHLCRNRACVNVDHMEVVTDAVNMARGAHGKRDQTRCANGHPFDEANTLIRVRPDGAQRRDCRACHQDHNRRRREAVIARGGKPRPKTNLTNTQVTEIRQRYAAGDVTYSQLGGAFGVSAGVISQVVRRVSYRHVP